MVNDWITKNWIEVFGMIFGLCYIFFSIKQHILTWLFGLLTAILYAVVFYISGLYATMALQLYYVVISVYGWWFWSSRSISEKLAVTKTSWNLAILLCTINALLLASIYILLSKYTDSAVPLGDAIIASTSIVATWMLARKKIEQWLLWVVLDLFSAILFLHKELYFTTILFFAYSVLAIYGYYSWHRDIKKKEEVGL